MATRDEIVTVLQSGADARRAGHLEEALGHMNEALALCGPDQDYERAHVLRELGELARSSRDLKTAQAHYEEAVVLLRTSQDRLKLAHAIRHLGDVHATEQHWFEAEKYFIEALDIYRGHPATDPLDLANALRPYALLKTRIGQTDDARALWVEAGEWYQAAGVEAGVAECRRRADPLNSRLPTPDGNKTAR